MSPAPARPAATVLILRPGDAGPELLLLRRSGRSGFFPDAWVFPGGRVEEADHSHPFVGACPGLDGEPAWAVAAVRETFEEAGIWLGRGQPGPNLRAALLAGRATLADRPDLVADLDRVRFFAWWVTPEEEPRRYDTRFLLTRVSREEVAGASPCQIETVQTRWLRPCDAVTLHHQRELFLAPPTYRVLEELAETLARGPDAVDALPPPAHPIQPRLVGGRANPATRGEAATEGIAVLLPGDPEHPSPHPVTGPTRIVLVDGAWHSAWAPGADGPRVG